jgi:hypothetical protein
MSDREDPEKARWLKFVAEHPDCGLDTELNDLWLNAVAAYPDLEPLARLIVRGTPMPPSVQDLFRNQMFPQDPPIDAWVLKVTVEQNSDFDNLFPELDAAHSYAKARAAKESSEQAAITAGEQHHVSDRHIHRYRAHIKRLGRRLRGDDQAAAPRRFGRPRRRKLARLPGAVADLPD